MIANLYFFILFFFTLLSHSHFVVIVFLPRRFYFQLPYLKIDPKIYDLDTNVLTQLIPPSRSYRSQFRLNFKSEYQAPQSKSIFWGGLFRVWTPARQREQFVLNGGLPETLVPSRTRSNIVFDSKSHNYVVGPNPRPSCHFSTKIVLKFAGCQHMNS